MKLKEVNKVGLLKLSEFDQEHLEQFVKVVHPFVKHIQDIKHFGRFVVETKIVPDVARTTLVRELS